MRKSLALLLLAAPCLAAGPKYVGQQTPSDIAQEFGNVYQDIRNPVVNYGSASTFTVTRLSVSTITLVSSATVTNLTVLGTLTTQSSNLNIKQIKVSTTTTQTTTTSNNGAATSLVMTFTPLSASSTIYFHVSGDISTASTGDASILIQRTDDGTNLNGAGASGGATLHCPSATTCRAPVSLSAWDPNHTAASHTWKVFIVSIDNATSVSFPSGNTPVCTMTAWEVL